MEEEIRRLQEARKKKELGLARFGDVSSGADGGFDEFLFGGDSKPTESVSFAPAPANDGDGDGYGDDGATTERRRALPSFTAPEAFFRDVRAADAESDVAPAIDTRKKVVAEREDDYKRRWRKRMLSPPKADPYALAAKGPRKETGAGSDRANADQPRTYRDAVKEAMLEKEEREIELEIARKAKDEAKEAKAKCENEREARKSLGGELTWAIVVVREGATIEERPLVTDACMKDGAESVVRFGREDGSDVVLMHASCSSRHAKVKVNGDSARIVDMGSTNGTTVDGRSLTPGTYVNLRDGAVVRFGASSREYVFMRRK